MSDPVNNLLRNVLTQRAIPYVGPGDAMEAIVLEAMRAGLRGKPMPCISHTFSGVRQMLNAVYDEARNWHAGQKVKAK